MPVANVPALRSAHTFTRVRKSAASLTAIAPAARLVHEDPLLHLRATAPELALGGRDPLCHLRASATTATLTVAEEES